MDDAGASPTYPLSFAAQIARSAMVAAMVIGEYLIRKSAEVPMGDPDQRVGWAMRTWRACWVVVEPDAPNDCLYVKHYHRAGGEIISIRKADLSDFEKLDGSPA